MIAEGRGVEGPRGDGVGVGGVRAQPREHLRAHPLDRVLVEARPGERVAQERHRLVAVLGQEARRDRHRVVARVESVARGQRLSRGGEGGRVEVGGPLLQEPGHQVDRAACAGGVERGAAHEAQLEGHEGQRVVLHQPGVDAARRGDLLDLDLGAQRRGEREEREGRAGEGAQRKGGHHESSAVTGSTAGSAAGGAAGASAAGVIAVPSEPASAASSGVVR